MMVVQRGRREVFVMLNETDIAESPGNRRRGHIYAHVTTDPTEKGDKTVRVRVNGGSSLTRRPRKSNGRPNICSVRSLYGALTTAK